MLARLLVRWPLFQACPKGILRGERPVDCPEIKQPADLEIRIWRLFSHPYSRLYLLAYERS